MERRLLDLEPKCDLSSIWFDNWTQLGTLHYVKQRLSIGEVLMRFGIANEVLFCCGGDGALEPNCPFMNGYGSHQKYLLTGKEKVPMAHAYPHNLANDS
ncbi:hypothetical protein H5410_040821 [Solanum commersonii]|uniref:Uncharacterized protein n=1 Tax=Solanum commersonii TaxID=4109 RepID=A0A9J5XPW2_SOLCO|nr:hypothetical protein H5410_040821 [Solanum commersonii]